ncbi:MAG: DNA polymerase III subunit delta [Nitrospira sp.]|nr:DNA polymerase III subunit delta [Nitrospira sp.]MDH4371592.1 DNA polymerase III subunit delta [Nitrospira sp.]MDH5498929.1 DNA polymerase III subunit delta [Nitrospira sp.]MDH5725975.1 DNA polymerase III subunit delta [Nitrospira sp.]
MSPSVNHIQLEATLKQQGPGLLYLVVGEEDLLRDHAIAALKHAVLGSDGDEFNCELFYGDEASGSHIHNSVAAVPVFAPRRLVVVKSAEKLTAREGDLLLDCVQNPVESTTLVFVSPKLDGRLKFSQALLRAAVVVDCSPLRDAQLSPWITREAERVGLQLEERVAQVLQEACGASLYGLRRELEKLASYVPSDRSVTVADVHLLRGVDPGASVFDLTLAIAEGDRGRVLSILARNLEAGEAPLRILGSLVWQYRRLWKVKELLANGCREGEAARSLRMDPRKVRPFLERFSEAHLQQALRLFLDTDSKLKGGSGSRPRMVLEGLLLKLCEEHANRHGKAATLSQAPPKRAVTRVVSNVRTIKSRNPTAR